jgi:hypothetical protein
MDKEESAADRIADAIVRRLEVGRERAQEAEREEAEQRAEEFARRLRHDPTIVYPRESAN